MGALREDQVPYLAYRGVNFETGFTAFPLPVPTRGKPRNELTIARRLFWIAVLIFGMGIGAGAVLSGFAALSKIALALSR